MSRRPTRACFDPPKSAPSPASRLPQQSPPASLRLAEIGSHIPRPDRDVVVETDDGTRGADFDSDVSLEDALAATSPVQSLFPEVLVRIFACLDPISLLTAARVCRTWSVLASDEVTWKQAFTRSLAAAGAFPDAASGYRARVAPTFRRVNRASFRGEALTRLRTQRLWRKSRVASVTTSPRMGPLNDVAIAWHHRFMLGLSLVYGVAVRSDPVSGKLARGLLQAQPPPGPGLVPGHLVRQQPNAAIIADAGDDNSHSYVTHVASDADGSRIVWGLANGVVRVTSLTRQGSHPRGLIRTNSAPAEPHGGAVTALSLPLSLGHQTVRAGAFGPARTMEARSAYLSRVGEAALAFASGGQDGSVRIWGWVDHRPQFLWSGSVPQLLVQAAQKRVTPQMEDVRESTHYNDPNVPNAGTEHFLSQAHAIDALDFDPAAGALAAATSSGVLALWWGFTALSSENRVETPTNKTLFEPEHMVLLHPPRGHTGSVARIAIDASPDHTRRIAALLQFEGDTGFYRIDVNLPERAAKSGSLFASELRPNTPSELEETVRIRWWRYNATSSPFATLKSGVDVSGAFTSLRADFDVRASPAPPIKTGWGGEVTSVKGGALGGVATPLAADGHLIHAESRWDPFAEHKFIVAGTERGALLVFSWDDNPTTHYDTAGMDVYAADDLDSWSPAPVGSIRLTEKGLGAKVWGGQHEAIFALPVSPASSAASGPVRPESPSSASASTISGPVAQASGTGDPDAVTSIDLSGCLLAAGTADGMVRVYDSLSGGLVRTFADRAAGRSARGVLSPWEFVSRFEVKQILLSDVDLAAVVGHQVLAWRPEVARSKPSVSKGKRARPSARIPGDDGDSYIPVGPEQAARAQRQAAAQRRWGSSGGALEDEWEAWPEEEGGMPLDLGEDEALAYALLLSQEDAKKDQKKGPSFPAEEEAEGMPPMPAFPSFPQDAEDDAFASELQRAMQLSSREGTPAEPVLSSAQTEEEELAAALRAVEELEAQVTRKGKCKAPDFACSVAEREAELVAERAAESVAEQAAEKSQGREYQLSSFPTLHISRHGKKRRGKVQKRAPEPPLAPSETTGPDEAQQATARAAAAEMGMDWDEMEEELRMAIYESLGL